jgi:hypothetical protein
MVLCLLEAFVFVFYLQRGLTLRRRCRSRGGSRVLNCGNGEVLKRWDWGTSKFVHMSFVRRGAGAEDGGKSLYFRSIGIDREVGPNVSSGEASSFKCHM